MIGEVIVDNKGNMNFAPIILFVYNRPWHTQQTIEALLKNFEAFKSDLYIFADGLKSTATEKQSIDFHKTREYIHTISGFRSVTIIESEQNKGLGNSIIYGVTKTLEEYDSVIVLEDDIVVSPHFLRFMNESLYCYNNHEKVIGICGVNYSSESKVKENSFFIRGGDCGGWATWKRAWKLFNPNAKVLLDYIIKHKRIQKDFTFNGTMYYMDLLRAVVEGKNDSWAIRWYASTFISEGLCLYPRKSLVQNIGFGDEATNTKSSERDIVFTRIKASEEYVEYTKIPIKENKVARKEFESIYESLQYYPKISICKKIKRWIKKVIAYNKNAKLLYTI